MNKLELYLKESQRAFEYEVQRSESETTKAEKYLVAIGVVISFGLITLPETSNSAANFKLGTESWLLLASILTLFLSFIFTLLALRIRDYKAYPKGDILKSKLKKDSVDDKAAILAIAEMYNDARESYYSINENRASLLRLSSYFLIGGFLLAIGSQLAAALLK